MAIRGFYIISRRRKNSCKLRRGKKNAVKEWFYCMFCNKRSDEPKKKRSVNIHVYTYSQKKIALLPAESKKKKSTQVRKPENSECRSQGCARSGFIRKTAKNFRRWRKCKGLWKPCHFHAASLRLFSSFDNKNWTKKQHEALHLFGNSKTINAETKHFFTFIDINIDIQIIETSITFAGAALIQSTKSAQRVSSFFHR